MTAVVKNLLILNVIMFVARYIIGEEQAYDYLALHYPTAEKFLPVQIVTHFFMHGSLMHIFFNMFALITFGSVLETLWGPQRFLFYYFFCAFGAAILHMGYNYYEFSTIQQAIDVFQANPSPGNYWAFFETVPQAHFKMDAVNSVHQALMQAQPDPATVSEITKELQSYLGQRMNTPIVGASGAIYGLLLAFGMSFPNAELMLIFFPVPVKAKYFIPVLMLIELFLGVNQFSWDNIAHFAHLGGALSGLLLILYWRKFGSRFDKTRYK